MTWRLAPSLSLLCTAFVTFGVVSNASAQIVQAPGTDYLVFEAEDFTIDELNNVDEDNFGTGWIIIDPTDPQEVELHNSNPGTIMVPPPNANPSGGKAIFDLVGGGDFVDQVGWELNFANPGEYFVYLRYSSYDMREIAGRNDYGHEDSIYLPPFDLQDDPAGPDPEIRDERAGQSSLRRNVGSDFTEDELDDVLPTDGCRIDDIDFENVWQIPEDECERAEISLEGQYHWQKLRFSDDSQENRHTSYIIEETGVVLDFAIATRERGSSLDAFVFSQNSELSINDLDALLQLGPVDPFAPLDDGTLTDPQARADYIHNTLMSWVGDSNNDREFNSSDLVAVFGAGEYEDEVAGNSTYATGDWDGNKEFDSSDLVAAFTDGGYEVGPGPPPAAAAVPEPSSLILLLIGMLACLWRAR